MAKNDVILLDGILDQRVADAFPSANRDEVFEYLAFEEILKDYDLSRDEIENGWIDGRNDGGIDGFYIFINGHLLDDSEGFVWPKSHASIEIWLFTCKHHPTFQQAALDAVLATVQELFDLELERDQLKGSYSEDLLDLRDLFVAAYRRLSIGRPVVSINVVYASRGDTSQIGEAVVARSKQIEGIFSSLFSSSSSKFRFAGATEIIELHRKGKKFALDLPFTEHLATGRDSYVLLVKLRDYWKFVSDENGQLRRYLFDSNVRDFLGANQVNADISQSLGSPDAPDFWWLNNGVTILATSATVPGKTIQLQDIQIVNGLQTTESIYRHFQDGSNVSMERALLVKIIVSSDDQVRDQIIRATNNQSPVEIAALHATDRIQRDIEDILERGDWFYERRRNYYRNIGKPSGRFVTPIYLASAVVALAFKNPIKATRLKTRFMRTQSSYDAVFSQRFPLQVWPKLVEIFKRVDAGLVRMASRPSVGERFVATWRPLISLMIVARAYGTFSYSPARIADLVLPDDLEAQVEEIWGIIASIRRDNDKSKPSPQLVQDLCRHMEQRFGILGRAEVGKRQIPSATAHQIYEQQPLPEEFLSAVDMLLPAQPWAPAVHLEVASKLNCKASKASRAIQQLISDGRRLVQRDGVVYSREGLVVAVDPSRVPQTIEELNAPGDESDGP